MLLKKTNRSRIVLTLTLLMTLAFVALPAGAENTAMRFYGIVRHVSANNIKVYNPVQKKTISFIIAPKFHNVFKKGSKTTQLSEIAPGQYVEVRYDRKLLGQAHADRISLLDRDNRIFNKQ